MAFSMQKQQLDQWCWAAVSVCVNNYFIPSAALTQCQMASAVLGQNCWADPEPCDKPAKLQQAFGVLQQVTASGPHKLTFPVPRSKLTFDEIESEIDNCLPVCVRIGWAGGGGHFVVIYGCGRSAAGEELLDVADPFYGYGTLEYQEFCSSYLGSGRWTNTFQVRV